MVFRMVMQFGCKRNSKLYSAITIHCRAAGIAAARGGGRAAQVGHRSVGFFCGLRENSLGAVADGVRVRPTPGPHGARMWRSRHWRYCAAFGHWLLATGECKRVRFTRLARISSFVADARELKRSVDGDFHSVHSLGVWAVVASVALVPSVVLRLATSGLTPAGSLVCPVDICTYSMHSLCLLSDREDPSKRKETRTARSPLKCSILIIRNI